MGQYGLPLPAATTNKMFSRWLSVIKRRECASVISLPKFDRIYRVNQFISWCDEQNLYSAELVPLSFQSLVTEVWPEFAAKLNKLVNRDKQTVFLVTDADWLLSAALHLVPQFAGYVLEHSRRVSFIFFFEHDILGSDYKSLFGAEPLFNQNLIYQPLYSRDDIFHFLHHMEQLYGTELNDVEREAIWQKCGGYIWLATEALRHRHETGTLDFTSLQMRRRLTSIWDGFSFQERSLLTDISLGKPISIDSLTYFLETGLINGSTQPTIKCDLLREYVVTQNQSLNKLGLQNKQITIGTVNVTEWFSEQERVILTFLLEHRGLIVKRSELAQATWGTQDYSEWSFDQAISRLRKKITSLNPTIQVPIAVRGHGIILH